MNSLDAAFVPIAAPADQLAMPLLTSRNYRCQCGQPVYFRNSACLTCGTALGYDVPAGLAELGMESEFRSAIDAAAAAHALIERDAGSAIAQYVVPLAFRLRWEIRPKLEEGRTVVAAPYVNTAVAFGRAAGVPAAWLTNLFQFAPRPAERVVQTAAAHRGSDRKGFVEFACGRLGPYPHSRRDIIDRTRMHLKTAARRIR